MLWTIVVNHSVPMVSVLLLLFRDEDRAGSESRPPMLNKENYIPWSSRLLWYAKSRPNGKLIHNSILNGPYVRKIIPKPDDELFDKELKQIEADDQDIQTILLGLPEDIYAAVDSCETAQEIWLRVIQNAVQNPRVQNVGNQNGLIGVQGNGNQNQIGNGNLVAARAEGNAAGQNGNQITCYNCRRVASINLGTQTDSAPIYDTDGSAEVHENYVDNEIFNMFTQEEQYTELLEPIPESHQVPRNDNDVISEDTSVEQDLQTELERTKEHFENCIIKKETKYAKLWNDWYKKCDECKYDKISYDKAYKDMQQKIKRLQAQLGDLKELEFQVLTYARENAHLKATYKNLFDSISMSRAQTKTIIASLQNELQSNINKNAKLRTQLFKKVSDQKYNTQDTSKNTKFAKQPIVENLPKVGKTNALSNPVTSNSVPTPQESKGVNNDKVIAPGMFRINPSKTSREEKHVPNTLSASARTKPITVSQPPVITKKDVNSDLNGLSSTGVDNTKTRRPQPRSNTENDRKCLIYVNHDKCLSNYMNGKNSCGKNQKAKVSVKEVQMKYQPKVTKPKNVEHHKSLATPKPRKPRFLLRWSPTGRLFNQEGKLAASSNSESQYD
uniref:Uncharacterized protein n=1 Tax=Tanacetum cinerariifolium TaxID=118510 RepID=A0A6L2J3B7_TANCI|nr:hypothetical protein [Tanacetum cinerariifolium]